MNRLETGNMEWWLWWLSTGKVHLGQRDKSEVPLLSFLFHLLIGTGFTRAPARLFLTPLRTSHKVELRPYQNDSI
jgi:hypothetical protein